ncbi:MAG: hypothetical protein HY078_00040 [Elusimicrobia bacterium]|nr:hypothetical protein [Elusimicrobiota bacterium]
MMRFARVLAFPSVVLSFVVTARAAELAPLSYGFGAARHLVELSRDGLLDIGMTPLPNQSAAPPRGAMIQKQVAKGAFGGRNGELLNHAPLFVLEKADNQKNILVVFATLTSDCKLTEDSSGKKLGFYWIDDWATRPHYKFPAGPLEAGIREELRFEENDAASFYVEMTKLGKVHHEDLGDERMLIRAQKIGGGCEARAFLKHSNATETRVTWVFADATRRSTFDRNPPVCSIKIVGYDGKTGRPTERNYRGKADQEDFDQACRAN